MRRRRCCGRRAARRTWQGTCPAGRYIHLSRIPTVSLQKLPGRPKSALAVSTSTGSGVSGRARRPSGLWRSFSRIDGPYQADVAVTTASLSPPRKGASTGGEEGRFWEGSAAHVALRLRPKTATIKSGGLEAPEAKARGWRPMSSPAGRNRKRAVGWGDDDGLSEDILVLEVGGLALSQQTSDGVLPLGR